MITLPVDLWVDILSYLEEELYAQKLRCTGAHVLHQALARRRSAKFLCGEREPNTWPPHLKRDSLLQKVVLMARLSLLSPLNFDLALHQLPKSLTSIELDLFVRFSPFYTLNRDSAASHIAELDVHLPNLELLMIKGNQTSGPMPFWTLPSSLTSFSGSGAQFDQSIALPPALRQLYPLPFDDKAHVWRRLGPILESTTLYWHVAGDNSFLPFPSMTSLYICSEVPRALEFLHASTHLRFLYVHQADGPIEPWHFPALEYFHCDKNLPPSYYSRLPKTLTRWTHLDWFGSRQLAIIHPRSIHLLPRSLKVLRLKNFPNPGLTGIINDLPSGLTRLEARGVMIEASQLQFLPTTLTSLQLFNINRHNVVHLERLRSLTDLGWYEGKLIRGVVKQLPKQVRRLTLAKITLVAKGHYQLPGKPSEVTKTHYRYDRIPQTTALMGTLSANLQSLTIKPPACYSSYYSVYFSHGLLQALPITLEELILDWDRQAISFFPPPESMRSGAVGDYWRPRLSFPNPEVSGSVTKVFARLTNLHHLFIACNKTDGDHRCVTRALPPQIFALALPRDMWAHAEACDFPATLRITNMVSQLAQPAILRTYATWEHAYHPKPEERIPIELNRQ